MRIALVLALLAFGCGNSGSGTAADAMTGADAGADRAADATEDAPAAQPDAAADVPATPGDAPPDVRSDAMGDAVRLDAGGDAGPFACGSAGLTCAANQYCVPQCCSPCGVIPDGGPCPTGATTCPLTGGATGCIYCTPAMCTNTIGLGCTLGGSVEPRVLFCLCN